MSDSSGSFSGKALKSGLNQPVGVFFRSFYFLPLSDMNIDIMPGVVGAILHSRSRQFFQVGTTS